MIEPRLETELNLTTFVCSGTPTPREVEASLSTFYGDTPTLHTIWDYTGCDLSALTADAISQLGQFLKTTSHSRAGGRSALVFSMEQLAHLNDRLPSLAELTISQATIKLFSDLEKARTWIAG